MKTVDIQKIISLILCVALCIGICVPVNAANDEVASGSCGTSLTWTLNSSGVLTVSGTGTMDEWSAETNVPWYSQKESITTVVISEGVTSIGKYAFKGCTNLTEVQIAEGITRIGYGAFQNCTALLSVDLPESVDKLDQSAFSGCSALKEVNFPASISSFGWGVFSSCTSLKNVILPEGINNSSTSYLFAWCTGLERVVLPKSFTYGADATFMGCTSLKTVIFTGDKPDFYYSPYDGYYQFENVTANCYYPLDNETWNNFSKGSYGGNLTWIGYEGSYEEIGKIESSININVNNIGAGSSGAVVAEPENGWVEGTNTFTVTCVSPCVVAVSSDGGSSYKRLIAISTDKPNTYGFKVEDMDAETILTIVRSGDANGDGKVNNTDLVRLKACLLEKTTLSVTEQLAADVNKSEELSNPDLVKLKAVLLDKTNFNW